MTVYNVVNVVLVDGQDRETSLSLVLQSDVTTLAGAQAAFDAWDDLYVAAGGGGIASASVTFPLTVTPTSADPDSKIGDTGWVKLLLADGRKPSYGFPMPKKTDGVFNWIVGGAVQKTDADLVAYFDQFKTAGALAYGRYTATVLAAAGGIIGGYLDKD